jgi:hypothetical protein
VTSQVNPGQWPPEVEHLPVCPHRKLPIPFIAEVGADGTGHFTILDGNRARECLKHRLCAMCGLPMGAEIALLGDVASLEPGGFWIEPPVHERCAEIATGGLCPFMSRERVPRRPPEDGVAIVGMGPDELAGVGRFIPKRPVVMAITESYTIGFAPTHHGGWTAVYQAGPIVRVRRYAWDADGKLAEVQPAPARAVRVVRNQPRRRPRSRR